jgi:O-antigen ligase
LLLGVPFGAIVLLGALRSRQALQFGLIEFGFIVRRKAWWILRIGAGLVASLGWLGLERIANRASLDARWVSWQAGYQLWRAFPLNGVGPGGFFWNYPAFLPLGQTKEANLLHPHNVWLEFMTMWGVAGLLWLLGLLAALWLFQHRRASRSGCVQRSETRSVVSGFALQTGLIAALAAAFIHAQVDAFMILPDLAAWNWLAGALLLNLDE